MKTVEVTPLGTFDVHWGVGSPEAIIGPLGRLTAMANGVTLRDPVRGETKSLDAWRVGSGIVLMVELSNGIWAVGTPSEERP